MLKESHLKRVLKSWGDHIGVADFSLGNIGVEAQGRAQGAAAGGVVEFYMCLCVCIYIYIYMCLIGNEP